jgi:hypothetical protein
MKTHLQTDVWIQHIAIVLGIILAASIAEILILTFTQHAIPEILTTLGWLAVAGLARLLISPLIRGL